MDELIIPILLFVVSLVLFLASAKILKKWKKRVDSWTSPQWGEEFDICLIMGWAGAMGLVGFGGCTLVSVILIITRIFCL